MAQHPEFDAYPGLLADIKHHIQQAQVRAVFAVNREMIVLYWTIGRTIRQRQEREGWGAKVINRLAIDIKRDFPGVKGFSVRNMKYMVAFAKEYDAEFVQKAAAQLPWWHNIVLIDRVKSIEKRIFYIEKVMAYGWSKDVLIHQIESGLYARQGKAINNFAKTLPEPQSDLATQALKDPYIFDFLAITEDYHERELENELIRHLEKFLLELGAGFAFVGRQIVLDIAADDYRIDLLFFHYKLNCFVVADLKVTEFKPEYAGKMNFYISAVDDLYKLPVHNPTIGLLLCKTKDKVVAEYALRGMTQPIGISAYQLVRALPDDFKSKLPSIEEIEAEMERELRKTISK